MTVVYGAARDYGNTVADRAQQHAPIAGITISAGRWI
jgi:hypothetical protein